MPQIDRQATKNNVAALTPIIPIIIDCHPNQALDRVRATPRRTPQASSQSSARSRPTATAQRAPARSIAAAVAASAFASSGQ
jgi:hypothetical protein